MASSGSQAQDSIRAHGSSKCSKHYGKEVIYVCEACDILACIECATAQHKGHELESLMNTIPKSKQKLKDFITRAECEQIPRIKEKLQKVNADLSTNKRMFQNQIYEIQKRNETIKTELDRITDTLIKICHGLENENSDKFLNHQKELETQIDNLNSKIQEVKVTLQSENDVLLYDTSHTTILEDLPIPSCTTAKFVPGNLPMQKLKHLFGELNIIDHHCNSLSLSHIANWVVVSEFASYEGNSVKSMHPAGDKVWLSFFKFQEGIDNKLMYVNQKGQVQQSLHMADEDTDFGVSPETGNIWYCCGNDKSVREVKDSRTQIVKFRTSTMPRCICLTRDNHVLVGLPQQIVKYTQTGQEVCRTSGGTPPVVRSPYHISECPVTNHIAVVDKDSRYCGGDGTPFVSILDNTLQLLHIYRGEVSDQLPPPVPFHPNDVDFTNTGELVITDNNNKSVVLVTGTGKYLQTLYTSCESNPIAVSAHGDALWVSFNGETVRVFNVPQ